jgi:hypothetical protein
VTPACTGNPTNETKGCFGMKNVYEVLRQKEADRLQIESEIEALRLVIPLLDENASGGENSDEFRQETPRDPRASEDVATVAEKQSAGTWWKLASH